MPSETISSLSVHRKKEELQEEDSGLETQTQKCCLSPPFAFQWGLRWSALHRVTMLTRPAYLGSGVSHRAALCQPCSTRQRHSISSSRITEQGSRCTPHSQLGKSFFDLVGNPCPIIFFFNILELRPIELEKKLSMLKSRKW